MAKAEWDWLKALALAVLLLGAGTPASPQSSSHRPAQIGAKPGADCNSAPLATKAIAKGVQATVPCTLPHPNPIQTASQQGDPVSTAVTTTLPASELQSLPVTGRRWKNS